jgi:hypothetical protein
VTETGTMTSRDETLIGSSSTSTGGVGVGFCAKTENLKIVINAKR